MQLIDTFKFGKFKGQSLEEVLSSPRGKSWLTWYVNQPSSDPKYAEIDLAKKDSIRKFLQKDSTEEKKTQSYVATTIDIYTKLEQIGKKIDVLLAYIKPPESSQPKENEETWDNEEE